MIIRSKNYTKNIHFIRFEDIRKGVTLKRVILWRLDCTTKIVSKHFSATIFDKCSSLDLAFTS